MDMDFSLIISCIAGIIFGSLLSFLFSKNYSANGKINSIFGMDVNSLIANIIFFAIIFTIILFSTLSYLVKDLDYPSKHPFYFFLETLFATFVPASIMYAMMFLRGIPSEKHRHIEYLMLSAKFGLLHILFQFSGFYTYVFPEIH